MKTTLKDLVLILDYNWFSKKNEYFLKEPFYSKKHEKIYEIIPHSDYHEDDRGNLIEEGNDIVLDIDLANYCWNSYFEGSLQKLRPLYEIPDSPTDAWHIAQSILSLIIEHTEKYTEPKAINNYILTVVEETKNVIKELIAKNHDPIYGGVLDNFFSKTRKEISKKFYHIKQQIELDSYEERLEFNLTQEKLAALLYILNKAEVFNTINFNDTTFLRFCQQFFYFKFSGGYKRPKSFGTLSEKYREFVRGENSRNLEEIKALLTKTLENI
jgi:hypothetical protein